MTKIKFFEKLLKSSKSSASKSNSSQEIDKQSSLDSFDAIHSEDLSSADSKLLALLNENLICSCCLEILRNPLTLLCGHSFCQLCLANWYITSSNKKCPTCRQEWLGVPHINHMLKTTIEKLVKYQLSQPNQDSIFACLTEHLSKTDKYSLEEKNLIKNFEEKCKSTPSTPLRFFTQNLNNNNDNFANLNNQNIRQPFDDLRNRTRRAFDYACYFIFGVLVGLILALFLFGLVWLISYSSSTNHPNIQLPDNIASLRRKYSKPIEAWSHSETQEWLFQLGPWTDDIVNIAQSLKLDGSSIFHLNDTILAETPFSIQDEEIRKLLLSSIQGLRKSQLKSIDFWEFKNLYKFQVVFTSLFYEAFPRLSILYSYYVDYEDSFKLLVKFTEKNILDLDDTDFVNIEYLKKYSLNKETTKNQIKKPKYAFESPEASSKQSTKNQLSYLIKYPFIHMKNVFNIFFYDTNKLTCIFVSINCLILTLIDYVLVIDFVRSLIGWDLERIGFLSKHLINKNLLCAIYLVLVYQLWSLIPNFLIDLLYFNFIFLKIFYNINLLTNYSKSFYESVAHYFIRPNH